jgi:DNA gyrase/topoisomerase IV subunit A
MKNKNITLSQIAKQYWREYALYTLEDRAIPSIVDGLKPSQRFILYSALKNAKDKFIKVAEIAGNVSSYGYHHGEVSVENAATAMSSTWQNNNPLLEGDGNFGSRLIQKAAAARYIYATVSKNFFDFFTDTDLAPPNEDEDIKTPRYYLPLIPYVLLNGVSGVATGFATNILPYDAKDVTKLIMDHLSGKNIDSRKLVPKYPQFTGKIEPNIKGGWDLVGTYELKSKTKLTITEIPYQYDRESYIEVLDALEENGVIANYSDECGMHGFQFGVTLPRNFAGDIEKVFKLRKSVMENLSVINHDGKLKEYSTPIELIKDFCDFRITYVKKRIEKEIIDLMHDMALLKSKITFIEMILANKIIFKQKSKKILIEDLIKSKFRPDHINSLLNMNFYHLTTDEIDKLSDRYLDLNDRLTYCKATTPEIEYGIDLNKLYKTIK